MAARRRSVLNAGRVVEVGRLARGAARRGRVAAPVRLLARRVRRRRGHSAGRLEREDFGSHGSVGCAGLLHDAGMGSTGTGRAGSRGEGRGRSLLPAVPGVGLGEREARGEKRERESRLGERVEWKGDVGGGGCSA